MSGTKTNDQTRTAGTPWFWPVLELGTGRVAGAQLVRGTAPVPVAARAFVAGAPVREDWWVGVGLRRGAVVAPTAGAGVQALLRDAGLAPEQLVLRVTEAELVHAAGRGGAAAIASLGVRFAIGISLAGLHAENPSSVTAVRAAAARAASLGGLAIGADVETDAQVALAGEAGLDLVQGYSWGSPGSLGKIADTWARQPVSG